MHIPSARIYKEMRSEVASIWFATTVGDGDVALLVKSTTASIKALVAGCDMSLVFGIHNNFFCAGVRIFDIPDHPLFICGVERHEEDHLALAKILELLKTPVFLFNELDVCLAWSNAEISNESSEKVRAFTSDAKLYTGPFAPDASYALDCFCFSTDNTRNANGALSINFVEIPISLEKWHANHVSFIGVNDSQTVLIDDPNEGAVLERAIWASLESVFPLTLHMGPQVKVGEKFRELTDVLAFHEYGSFLIEAKDLSVLQSGFGREQARRTKGTQKQVKKAITQLIGAAKAAKRREQITDSKDVPLSINLSYPFHCIVLVTELMNDGDWREVEEILMQAMIETGDFFHVLDLQELITLLKCSRGNPQLFDYNLMQRCKNFVKSGTIHMRSRPAPLKQLEGEAERTVSVRSGKDARFLP